MKLISYKHIWMLLLKLFLCFPVVAIFLVQNLESAPLEPGLQGREDVILYEDFEDVEWFKKWGENSLPPNSSIVTSPVFEGNTSLRVRVPEGSHYGLSMGFSFLEQGFAEPEEIYFRYYVFLGSQWRRDGREVGKLPGIGGTYNIAGWGGRPSHGDDGWSARMMNHDAGDKVLVGFYCYHADMSGTYGDHLAWVNDDLGYLDRQKWNAVEVYAKVNTITGEKGNNDGVLRGWVNGKLAFEKTDLRFRDVDHLKIEKIWFDIYVGGTWTAPQDMDVYFDNAVIARNYIGPLEVTTIPCSPTNLQLLTP